MAPTSSSTSRSTSRATSASLGTNAMIDERGEGQTPRAAADRPARRRQARVQRNERDGRVSRATTSRAPASPAAARPSINGSTQTCARPPFNWYVTTVKPVPARSRRRRSTTRAGSRANDTINSTSTVAGQDGDCDVRSGTPPIDQSRHAARRRCRNDQPDARLGLHVPQDDRRHAPAAQLSPSCRGTARRPSRSRGRSSIDGNVTFNDLDRTTPIRARPRSTPTAPSRMQRLEHADVRERDLRLHDVEPEQRRC